MSAAQQFARLYLQYRRHHSPSYAIRIAYGIAYCGLPF